VGGKLPHAGPSLLHIRCGRGRSATPVPWNRTWAICKAIVSVTAALGLDRQAPYTCQHTKRFSAKAFYSTKGSTAIDRSSCTCSPSGQIDPLHSLHCTEASNSQGRACSCPVRPSPCGAIPLLSTLLVAFLRRLLSSATPSRLGTPCKGTSASPLLSVHRLCSISNHGLHRSNGPARRGCKQSSAQSPGLQSQKPPLPYRPPVPFAIVC
jgi:hypothetical protein